MAARLTEPFTLAGRTAPSRVLFGPHETNFGARRSLSERHVAYYERRAEGGTGILVVENASVHASDHPYERAPLADECGHGWNRIAATCRPHGTLVLAGLTHHGLQGSSAHTRSALWGPSRVADVETREMPMVMEQSEIDAVIAGFETSADAAARAGLAGVEIDAGPRSLLRQFHSGLTNLRTDEYGDDPLLLTKQVLAAVRRVLGREHVLSLRLCCDELAPWAGITPEIATRQVRELAPWLDLLVAVRGGPMSTSAYRPDFHEPVGFNSELCSTVRKAAGTMAVALQGSVTEPEFAQRALDRGVADVVEMTRAQIADPDLVNAVRERRAPRPCVRCNQACLVRHPRNPIVSCVVEPDAGYELDLTERPEHVPPLHQRRGLVAGAGPAGLEAARVLAGRGFAVTVVERSPYVGGMVRTAAVAIPTLRTITDHLESECRRLGVEIRTDTEFDDTVVESYAPDVVIAATGSRARPPEFLIAGECVDAAELLGGSPIGPGPVVVYDPVGGPIGVATAEWLHASGREVSIVSPDPVLGRDLALSGDLVGANVRAQRKRIVRHLDSKVIGLDAAGLHIADRYTDRRRLLPCSVLVDCSHRLPDRSAAVPDLVRVGDCVAPRTVLEAILEGRRAARAASETKEDTRQEN